MEKIWLKKYPAAVAPDIKPDTYRSVFDIYEEAVRHHGPAPAFTNLGVTMSFNELAGKVDRFASFLQHELRLKKGDRIAIQMPNLLQFPVAAFGALKAGLIVVNTNPLYTAKEMEHQFKDSGAKAIVILANYGHLLEQILKKTDIESVVVTEVGDLCPFPKNLVVNGVVKYIKKMVPPFNLPQAYTFRQALELGGGRPPEKVDCHHDDIAFLQYTGGTTGVAKGAMLTHKNIISNMLQIAEWMKPKLSEGREIAITALPMYHIFSLTVNCLAFMRYGAHNILITNPRDIPAFIKDMRAHRFTIMSGVNTLFNALMNHPDFNKIDFSALKVSVAGAMALQRSVCERWMSLTKSVLVEGYGLTEASPVVCCNPIDGNDKVGTIGLPLPGTDIKFIDDDGNTLRDPSQPGELCCKGPQVMKGYWQRPDETAKVLDKDGWLRTGDVATLDAEGYVKIVDRKKDLIIVSGFNVYPNEVEEAIAAHPGVLEVAAIGVPNEHSGEAVKVVVVKKDPALTEQDVIDQARQSLTGYKVPKVVEFRTELPKTNVGKILRRALRD
ncbi:MAG: AMP-binding protein [Bdellovibrionaceae bacterium]|nr:AMP-binding protein [Pseudobdellovibrionaceae bacterium]MBX3034719.1 AMP-binding protein [Pseudobdellovibrionaceae bacterium]